MQIIAIDGAEFTITDRPLIATWPRTDVIEPETARVFTGDEYARWAETNHHADAFPWPLCFYGLAADGGLIDLHYEVTTSDFDDNDYATVAHVWTAPDGSHYAFGITCRDGRA